MKTCTICGAVLEDNAVACNVCGANQPMQGQPMQGQPMQGQPMQGQPMQGQPMQGQPMQGQPMQGQPMQGQPMQGQPMQGQPLYGQPMQGQPMQGQPMYGQPMYGMPMQAPKKKKGLMIGVICGAVAIIAAITIVLVLVLGGDSSKPDYEGMIEDFWENIVDGNLDKTVDDVYPELQEKMKTAYEASAEVFSRMEGVTIDFEYGDVEDMSEETVQDWEDKINNTFDKSVDVEAGYTVEVTISNSLVESDTSTLTYSFIKEDGTWYIINITN